jgi:integrase/recombinase XerD
MKQLQLSNASLRYLEQSFKEWLDIMGYAPTSVYYMPLHVRELLHYLKGKGIKNIKELNSKSIQQYYNKLKERSNQRREGGLSNNHLNKHIQALRKFTDYLRQVGRLEIPALILKNEEADPKSIAVLSEEEIQLLFKATHKKPARNPNCMNDEQVEALQARDRAMLAIYYGCGLRRNEGVCLNVGDINFDRALVHVRKGKNYKERFVPVSKSSLKYLQDYVYDHRAELLQGNKSESFFVSQRGGRVQGQTLILRLKYLQQQTENLDLIAKEIGLHTLRHSIATHLLQAGMKLEYIARFLGHSSLESTQIYTHLAGVDVEQPQEFRNIPRYEKVKLHEDELY